MAKKKSLMDMLDSMDRESNKKIFGQDKTSEKIRSEKKMGQQAAKAKTNTKKAFDGKALLKTDKVKTPSRRNGAGERTPLSGGAGGSRPSRSSSGGGTSKPKSGSGGGSSSGGSSSSSSSTSNKAVKGGYTISGGQRKAGTRGSTNPRPMPSNPAVGYSKPVRKNFKTQAAFLKALEVYMRRKNRGADAARSTGKGKAKTATDGRQYGG